MHKDAMSRLDLNLSIIPIAPNLIPSKHPNETQHYFNSKLTAFHSRQKQRETLINKFDPSRTQHPPPEFRAFFGLAWL